MKSIIELIKEECPNGVPYKTIGDLCISLPKATLSKKELIENGKYPVVNSGRTFFGNYNSFNNTGNVITFASRGEYAGFVNYISCEFWAGGLCYPYRSKDESKISTKFLYYVLKEKESYIMETLVEHGSIPALNKSVIEDLKIPVPPLPVQEKIVEVLDTFTEYEAELEAELKARKRQYEFYRNLLLDFSEENLNKHPLGGAIRRLCPGGVEKLKIKDVYERLKGTKITAQKMSEIKSPDGEITIFAGGKTIIQAHEKDIPGANITRKPAVLIQSRGVVDAIYHEQPFTFKNEMWAYAHDNTFVLKYLYYVIKNNIEYFRNIAAEKGSMPQISLPATEEFEIYFPPLSIQEEIVKMLDEFSSLCEDISTGLPAEIAAVRKQYEHYRDLLLTFPEENIGA